MTARTLQHGDDFGTMLQRIRQFFDTHRARLTVTPGTQSATSLPVLVQVRDRIGKPWKGRWIIHADFTADPTFSLAEGTKGDRWLTTDDSPRGDVFITDANGELDLTLTAPAAPGSATLYLGFDRLEPFPVTWT